MKLKLEYFLNEIYYFPVLFLTIIYIRVYFYHLNDKKMNFLNF